MCVYFTVSHAQDNIIIIIIIKTISVRLGQRRRVAVRWCHIITILWFTGTDSLTIVSRVRRNNIRV